MLLILHKQEALRKNKKIQDIIFQSARKNLQKQ